MFYRCGPLEYVYRSLIVTLLDRRYSEVVGSTSEVRNCILEIINPTLENFYFPLRKISEKYANAELKWYWSGSNSCQEIGQHAKMWLQLTDDGVTNNSAYGYILEKKYNYDQIQQIIELLKQDPNSRRAILNISDPCLNKIKTKDLQCTIALHFILRNNKLELTTYMRSNDVYFGLPYDYIYFVSLGKYVAEQLNVDFSTYIHNATSMHMYQRDFEKFVEHDQVLDIDYKKIIGDNYETQTHNF